MSDELRAFLDYMAIDTRKDREFVIDVMDEITEDFSIALKRILGNPNSI